MNTSHRYQANDLIRFSAKVFGALGVPADQADVAARCMITAHLRGFDTHGLPCLKGYVDALKEGRLNPKPKVVQEQLSAWSFRLDADNGLGHITAHQAMRQALLSARELGIGGAVVRRSNHFGAASVYSLMALPDGCIGIVTSNGSAVTAPFGAAEPILGTNPLSVAVPAGKMPPFVIDMATSAGSRKKIRLALENGESIPVGWSLDSEGNPTTDPQKALEGVMLPFGGMKGSAITMLLDILSGVLSGANFGGDVLSVSTNQERESGNGQFFLAFKASAFIPEKAFLSRMDEELTRMRSLKPAKEFGEVIYPGYKGYCTQQERTRFGVPLEQKLLDQMNQIAGELAMEMPPCASAETV